MGQYGGLLLHKNSSKEKGPSVKLMEASNKTIYGANKLPNKRSDAVGSRWRFLLIPEMKYDPVTGRWPFLEDRIQLNKCPTELSVGPINWYTNPSCVCVCVCVCGSANGPPIGRSVSCGRRS